MKSPPTILWHRLITHWLIYALVMVADFRFQWKLSLLFYFILPFVVNMAHPWIIPGTSDKTK